MLLGSYLYLEFQKMKKLTILTLIFSFFLISCTPNIAYIEPEIIGKIYNLDDNKPIKNTAGYIAFYLNDNKENYITTNRDGGFYLAPHTEKYFFIKPNLRELYMGTGQIYIQFEGYKSKIFDYTNFYQEQNPSPNPDAKKLEKVNIGVIYLEKE